MKRLLALILCLTVISAAAAIPASALSYGVDETSAYTEDTDADSVGDDKENREEDTDDPDDLEVTEKAEPDLARTGWSLLTEERFQTRMAEMRVKYPNGDIWEGVYYEDGMAKAWTCWAYSAQMLREFFGVNFYADGVYSKYMDYNVDDLCAGDWVRIDWDSHSIFITKVTGDGVYFTDGNGTGVYNQIRWDGFYSWSEIRSRFSYRLHLPGNNLKGSAPEDWLYTIDYNSNGGKGSMGSDTVKANGSFTLEDNAFTRSGYSFGGFIVRRSSDKKWYTTDGGWQTEESIFNNGYTYKVYPEGGSYTLGKPWIGGVYGSCTFTFFATWIPVYSIEYNANGGSGNIGSDEIKANDGFTLKNNGFARNGYTFAGYIVNRSYDDTWYTVDAGWQTKSDILDNGYTYKVYPEGGSYVLGSPWIGGLKETSAFTFYADWIPEKSSVEFMENYSGYNYLLGTDLGSDYSDYIYSRDTNVYSVSVDNKERLNNQASLKIVGRYVGCSGDDLAMVTSTNIGWGDGYSQQCTVGDEGEFFLRFCAKASVDGAKMYIRWGYSGSYKSVKLTKEWKTYTVIIPKNRFCGATLHPYFDKAGTYYLNSLALGDAGTSNVVPESGRWASSKRYVPLGEAIGEMPVPKRDGYTFLGWYTLAEYGTRITESTPITSSALRLYAHWAKNVSYTPVKTVRANGHVYELYDNKMGWEEAEAFCEKQGGHLISVDSAFENKLAYDMISDRQGYCWLGLSYDKSAKMWKWVNGEPLIFNFWYDQKFGTEDSGEYYAMMYPMNLCTTAYAGKWDKCRGSEYYRSYYGYYNSFFICEYDNMPYLGDADGSGSVDILDATIVQSKVVGIVVPFSDEKLMRGDVDRSGTLEVTDATFIQRYCNLIQTPFSIGSLIEE